MKALLIQILEFKPGFLPTWLFLFLLFLGVLVALPVAAAGLWVAFTQINYM